MLKDEIVIRPEKEPSHATKTWFQKENKMTEYTLEEIKNKIKVLNDKIWMIEMKTRYTAKDRMDLHDLKKELKDFEEMEKHYVEVL